MSGEVLLSEAKHPTPDGQRRFEELIGITDIKEQMLSHLVLSFDSERLRKWARKHHGASLAWLDRVIERAPAVLLSGEVGCGKTALASSIGSPLAKTLNTSVVCFETPSDIRGSGRVGEISARITAAFHQASSKLSRGSVGLLIIDEADDLATSRAQNQAHHEDRAGLNVLVKQLDLIDKERIRLGVVLITNRARSLDPAVLRRMTLHLRFSRPDDAARREVFAQVLSGLRPSAEELAQLVAASGPRDRVRYSYSDLIKRALPAAVQRAWQRDEPLSTVVLLAVLADLQPSPLIDEDLRDTHFSGERS